MLSLAPVSDVCKIVTVLYSVTDCHVQESFTVGVWYMCVAHTSQLLNYSRAQHVGIDATIRVLALPFIHVW